MDVPGVNIAVKLRIAHIEIGKAGTPAQMFILLVHLFPAREIAAVGQFDPIGMGFHVGHILAVSDQETW